MRRLHIICEGQTEEGFVRELLMQHLAGFGLAIGAPLLGTPGHKGGHVSWPRILDHLRRLLRSDRGATATTFIDYYGISGEFPGMAAAKRKNGAANKAQTVRQAMAQAVSKELDIGPERFIPYIQMHEFEGLLFSDPEAFAVGIGNSSLVDEIRTVSEGFQSPEDINDHPLTAPSKRIALLFPQYDKTFHGILAAIEVKLHKMRQECAIFNEWITQLESL